MTNLSEWAYISDLSEMISFRSMEEKRASSSHFIFDSVERIRGHHYILFHLRYLIKQSDSIKLWAKRGQLTKMMSPFSQLFFFERDQGKCPWSGFVQESKIRSRTSFISFLEIPTRLDWLVFLICHFSSWTTISKRKASHCIVASRLN